MNAVEAFIVGPLADIYLEPIFFAEVVIGGLLFSTMLTLILVPSYYSIAISLETRIARVFKKVIGDSAHKLPEGVAPYQGGAPQPAE